MVVVRGAAAVVYGIVGVIGGAAAVVYGIVGVIGGVVAGGFVSLVLFLLYTI